MQQNRQTTQRRRGRKGQALVEFALILPIFAMMVFGVIEFGRAFYTVHMLSNAAREGARTASLPDKTVTEVMARIQESVAIARLDTSRMGTPTITIIPASALPSDDGSLPLPDAPIALADAAPGDRCSVTVPYAFEVLTGTIIPGFSGVVMLNGRCTFRHE
jgi:TadE-like protein